MLVAAARGLLLNGREGLQNGNVLAMLTPKSVSADTVDIWDTAAVRTTIITNVEKKMQQNVKFNNIS